MLCCSLLPTWPLRLSFSLVWLLFLACSPLTAAIRLIESKSLNPCQANSSISASLFNVVFTPDNKTLSFNVVGVSDVAGNVTAEIQVFAYGFRALRQVLDPCKGKDLEGLCPLSQGQININSNIQLGDDVISRVPGIAYSVPDLDGVVRIYINDTNTRRVVACVEAELSNGKTVYHKAVAWMVAVIAGLGLVASAVTSGLGHSNTAAHVAANAMSLFGFFQAQALIGMSSANLPPIVAAWTQNFQWSMGIIRVGFLQKFCTWYQRATGGHPTSVLTSLATTSVQVQKRSLEVVQRLVTRAYVQLARRTNNEDTNDTKSSTIIVHGIKRVAFIANIEGTNIFMTGYTFFIIFVILIVLGVLVFKAACESLAKAGKMRGEKFHDFRNGWITVLKGILFRVVLIGWTQMCVLCFWELTVRDSAAEAVLAVFTIITMVLILGWASSKVIRIARRSIQLHQNPAYILFSDPISLNKWGFLYVQFKASSYYFVVPVLFYLMMKGMFIGLGQGNPVLQAVALVLLEAALLVGVSVLRPYMDRKTNAFNISIAAINFLSSILLLFFTEVFHQPGLVTGIMGWIFFVVNAAFALILLLMVLVASIYALVSKNPDSRYQPMRDDRGSFIKSQTQLTTELDALGAAARGDGSTSYIGRNIDDDEKSLSTASFIPNKDGMRPGSNLDTPGSGRYNDGRDVPRSPVEPSSVPLFHGDGPGAGRSGPPASYFNNGYAQPNQYSRNASPGSDGPTYRHQNNNSPWQRGAGYES